VTLVDRYGFVAKLELGKKKSLTTTLVNIVDNCIGGRESATETILPELRAVSDEAQLLFCF